MKKLLIAILAVFMVNGAFAQAPAFPDIPAGHWAGDAVSRIADLGIVIGFPDGTFRGNESFTRYQAALVISRLLDVVNSNIAAAKAMSDEDIASLRNALQELASDVAAQGVRLSAAEAAVATIADDVVANTARIEALEEAIANAGGIDPAVLRDLQNQLASLRVAVDTAQARAEAAEALANDALDQVSALDARIERNAAGVKALNDLVALLNQDVTALQDAVAGLGGVDIDPDLLSGVARNASDIANIREFVILLRRDQVALRDRVAGLEAADEEQAAAIADLEARLTEVEDNLLIVSGSISLSYEVGRLSGAEVPFDVDRLFGVGMDRELDASAFSTGSSNLNGDGDSTDVGEVAQDRQDIDFVEGETGVGLTLNIAFNTQRDGTGDPNALNTFSTVIELDMEKAVGLNNGSSPFDGYVFRVSDFTTTFDPIGAAPLTFQFGEDPSASFTPYVFASNGDGFVATAGGPDFLAFLAPTLTIAYGEVDADLNSAVDQDGDTDPENDDDLADTYYRGARLTLNPLEGVSLGGSFAQLSAYARENADAAADNQTITVWGVDGSISMSIFTLNAEYASSSGTITTPAPTSAVLGSDSSLFYVELDVDAASLPILNSLSANYRSMPVAWEGIFEDSGDYPWELDQNGFGVNAGLGLFILDINAYFDSYSVDAGDSASAFGVDVSADLFAGFALSGFFNQASVNGTVVDDLSSGIDANEALVVAGMNRNTNYETGFGVGLAHDGAADNALIDNLNLNFEYKQMEADYSETTILAEADYELSVSILTLTPYASYENVNDSDAGTDDTVTLKFGTGLETTPLNIFTMPSLVANVNYRNTDHSDADTYTASELQWGVGVVLNEFLFDNSTLSVRYASWTGTNIQDDTNTNGAGDSATDISAGDENNGLTQSGDGYEVVWNYYDLEFAYGAYNSNNGVSTTGGQSFSISYTVNF